MEPLGGQPLGGISEADFQPLIDLVESTIQPDTWQDTGQGLGTIEAFVPNLSLIVSQTQAIQDEIQDLLKKTARTKRCSDRGRSSIRYPSRRVL